MSTKPQYIFPRIGIVNLQNVTSLIVLFQNLEQYHGKYFHLFNLTNVSLFPQDDKQKQKQTKFKWRGTPFSVTQGIRVLNKLDLYLRTAKGNCAIICVNNSDAYNFSKVLMREYLRICSWGIGWEQKNKDLVNKLKKYQQSLTLTQPYFSQHFQSIYKSKQISSPPVKIISSFETSSSLLVPIIQIYQQTRYNDFQLTYTHQIHNQLAEYYYNLDKPLQTDKKSIGKKFYDRKPETKYLTKPVLVCGDVKIICYSYNTMEKKREFQLGFNTRNIIFNEQLGDNQGIITLSQKDLYIKQQKSKLNPNSNPQKSKLFDSSIQIYIKLQNWCDNPQCARQIACQECQQHCKKLDLRYNQIQSQLNVINSIYFKKFHRQRTPQQVRQYFSL